MKQKAVRAKAAIVEIDPLLAAMLTRLAEISPKWHADEALRWEGLWIDAVRMLYPVKPQRKSRAKKAE